MKRYHVIPCLVSILFATYSINHTLAFLLIHNKRLKADLRLHERIPLENVVIAGAGVIGISSAYFLSQNHASDENNPLSITLVDVTGEISPAASGKAGGFLALDWNDRSPIRDLARRSFDLHSELAQKFGKDRIMYRRLTCASISVNKLGRNNRPSGKKLDGVEWADNVNVDRDNVTTEMVGASVDLTGMMPLGDEKTIAQVHPKMLCEAMWDAVQKNPNVQASLLRGKVGDAIYESSDGLDEKLVGVKLEDGKTLDADAILYACGPWTEYGRCITGVKYHSVLIPTKPRVLTQSVFFDGCGDPEVYPRPDGTAYCCGFPDPAVKVTEMPGEEEVREAAIDRIVDAVREASGGKDGALGEDPEVKQSCYLPSTPDGLPMMGLIPNKSGCYVATGHSCWGILLGPGTGEAMASLISKGRSSSFVDLGPFCPERFKNNQLW